MSRIEKQDAYLFSFFDAVTEYLQSNSSELASFIRYWDETLCSKTIPSGEMDGIRILSIHKSKGLEFHTVLIPFCDWKLENETNNQLVWCAPPEEPYNAISLVPVNYSTTMAESIYRQDYLHERLQLWVDNLNLLYVAFTRAGQEPHPLEPEGIEGNHVRTPCQHPAPHSQRRSRQLGRRGCHIRERQDLSLLRPRLTA